MGKSTTITTTTMIDDKSSSLSSSSTSSSSAMSSATSSTNVHHHQQHNHPSTINWKQSLTTSPKLSHFIYILSIYRYVLLCLLFGSMSVITGVSLLSISLIIRSKTISIHLMESVPLYMPGLILICNGISMIAFMDKYTRRFDLLKYVCGLFLLVALLLIIGSVTTLVIHIPRLHSHRECVYTHRVRACTCVQSSISSSSSSAAAPSSTSSSASSDITSITLIDSKHFIMEEIDNCSLVHGIIYDSLRVIFILSLISLLISIFSIMTLYQLYIHEKQKIYFNQLNVLRNRIQQRNMLQQNEIEQQKTMVPSIDQSTKQYNYLYHHHQPQHHHNHPHYSHSHQNYPNSNERKSNVKYHSSEFSSQDMLLEVGDQTATNFGVTKPNINSNLSTSMGQIWSCSQSANIVEMTNIGSGAGIKNNGDCQSHLSVQFDGISSSNNKPNQTTLRRYMSTIIDRSSNLQTYVRQKLNSLRRINSLANDRVDGKRCYSKSQLLPPHVTIPRCSMVQSSVDSIFNVAGSDRINRINRRKSFSIQSTATTTSSSQRSSSSKCSAHRSVPRSDHQSIYSHHLQSSSLTNPANHHLNSNEYQNEKRLQNQQHEQISNTENYVQNESLHLDMEIVDSYPQYDQWTNMDQHTPGVANITNWSHSSIMDTFKCVDEDDFANTDYLVFEHSQFTNFGCNTIAKNDANQTKSIENNPGIETNDEVEDDDDNEENTHDGASNMGQFTFESEMEDNNNNNNQNRQYSTTFEEAFKNYYDSQHRISQNQNLHNQNPHYTLPKERSKSNEKCNPHLNPISKDDHHFKLNKPKMKASTNVKQCVEPNMSEDEFPAIEPPADYKNVATNDQYVPIDIEMRPQSIDTFTKPLMQPYHFWLQQFMEQMNQTEQMATNSRIVIPPPPTIDGYETDDDYNNRDVDEDDEDEDDEMNGNDDDDDAGDTSTSQDIADFELELDEEPIKFIGDDDYKSKVVERIIVPQPQPPSLPNETNQVEQIVNEPINDHPHHQNNLLQQNTDLIHRHVLLNNDSADFGFDGFRKSCFDDDDNEDESSSAQSSLSDGTHSSDQSTNSITAEYIKPPTPFTNYYINNDNI